MRDALTGVGTAGLMGRLREEANTQMDKDTFKGRPVRAVYDTEREEWVFSAADIVGALARPSNPRKYWHDLKKRSEGDQLSAKIGQLKLPAADGKLYKTDVLSAEGAAMMARRIGTPEDADALVDWMMAFDGAGRRFMLKHKEKDVAEIQLDEGGEIFVIGRVVDAARLPVGTGGPGGADFSAMREWWRGRSIPASRKGIREFLDAFGMSVPQQLLEKSLGLSLSDQYWICPSGGGPGWADVNFFDNDFSEDVGDILFGRMEPGRASGLFSPDNTSDGVLAKKWKVIDGKRRLIKGGNGMFPQEVANEFIASRICRRLGIPCVDYDIVSIDGRPCSVCDDFITGGTELVTAWQVMRLAGKDKGASDYERYVRKAESLGVGDARQKTDMMIALDFMIANTDRHWGNFGLVRDADTLEWLRVAPVYDSGTSMWCGELSEAIGLYSDEIESKPFRRTHARQIGLVKDFSWFDPDALDGVDEEYATALSELAAGSSALDDRIDKLCSALRRRIRLLERIAGRARSPPECRHT